MSKKISSENAYSKHWKGMPEFKQNDLKPIKQVIVSFATPESIIKFSKLVGQKILKDTQSIWYPQVPNVPLMNKRWTDSKPKKK